MISKMARKVELGSTWYIVSMSWIEKWQKHVNFEGNNTEDHPSPGKMNSEDIFVSRHRTLKNELVSSILYEHSI